MKKIDDLTKELIEEHGDDTDNNNSMETCKKYIEERKEERHRIGSEKRKNVVDTIASLIDTNNIKTFADWELKINYETKEELLKDFGLQIDTYANKIIKNKKNQHTSRYKYESYEQITIRDLKWKYAERLRERQEAIKWIYNLFYMNNINIIEFMAWITCIKNMTFIKINGMILEGPTNAGKSLIIDNIIRPLKPEEIPRERDNNGFHLDQLPFAACVIFEEPIITPTNVGTWKLLLEGKITKTDQKHRDKEAIERLPIFMTTATPITANIDHKESEQINQRIKLIQFQCTIDHRKEKYTEVSYNIQKIPKAPTYITNEDFTSIYFIEYANIERKIRELENQHQLNPERLTTKNTTIEAELAITAEIYRTKWDTLQNEQELLKQMEETRKDTTMASELDWQQNQEDQKRDTAQV